MTALGFQKKVKMNFRRQGHRLKPKKHTRDYERLRMTFDMHIFWYRDHFLFAFDIQAMYAEEQEAERKERASRYSHKGLTYESDTIY